MNDSSPIYDKYEAVIGLEVHIQLLTASKAYSSDSNEFGSMPNCNVSPITLGLPGTLPKANKKVINFAVKLGLAIGADIRYENQYARKNYFYADLPKGYQITQDKTPICNGGIIEIKLKDQVPKRINITRIHMEEDAGKSMHDQDAFDSLIDLNRAGVPLLEMVSEPELSSGTEAYAYLNEVRKLLRYLEICDGNMEEGSMRCDANVSVRIKGDTAFGKRVEVKNMNSVRNVQRAIEHEFTRQIDIIEKGGAINQETRSFDAVNGTTFSLRTKEMANDYRYFPEPDLAPVIVTENYIAEVKKQMPPLPHELHQRFVNEMGLSEYDALIICDHKNFALYFNELTKHTQNYKAAANWINGPVKSSLNERALEIEQFELSPIKIAEIIELVDQGAVSFSTASQKIFPALIANPTANAQQLAESNNWIQSSDSGELESFAKQAIEKFPAKVAEYRSGKTGLLGLFMGEVMKLSKGSADPKKASEIVKKMLEN